MVRKVSVAGMANDFMKRSASYVSLAGIQLPADEKHDVDSSKGTYAEGCDGVLEKAP